LKNVAILAALPALLLAAPAKAAPAKDDGKNTVIITADQLAKDINTYKVQKYGIHAHFVLPKNWELNEPEKDKSGKVSDDLPYYVILSHAPTSHPNDPTDLVFEMRIFKRGLTEDMPANTTKEKREEERGKRFWAFLNKQISDSTKMGMKLTTDRSQIRAKPYGVAVDANGNAQTDKNGKIKGKPGRPVQYFVPLHYDIKPLGDKGNGSKLFTFNTFTGDTIWQITFLVTKDQLDTFGGLITIIMDNSFGLTDTVVKQIEEEKKKAAAKAKNK
jgi:hypothetical protein